MDERSQFVLYSFSLIKKSEADVGIRMIDDGFAQICDMVNDLSMKVRTEAAGLLVGERRTNLSLEVYSYQQSTYSKPRLSRTRLSRIFRSTRTEF